MIPTGLYGGGKYTRAQGLGEQQLVAGLKAIVSGHVRGVDDARNSQPVFEFVVLHRMPARQNRPGFVHGIKAAAQDIFQYALWVVFCQRLRKKGHVHGAPRLAAHSVHIRKRVGCRYAAKGKGIVDDRRKNIHGLHQGAAGGNGKHNGVFVPGATSQNPGLKVRARIRRQTAQKSLQGPWSQLGSSTGCAGFFQQFHAVLHGLLVFIW